MKTINYTVAASNGDEVVRHYPHDDAGFNAAVAHADQFGYDVWESHDGIPHSLTRRARQKDVA